MNGTLSHTEFEAFKKIPRLQRPIVITEKLDGTNAQIAIDDDGTVRAGSRNRWITPEADNYGFAAWVRDHQDELRHLGPGRHYGEWWGAGIQRRYGLQEKRFSLFNVDRWIGPLDPDPPGSLKIARCAPPACCSVVPVLFRAPFFDSSLTDQAIDMLRTCGSLAAPGFMQPEGIVVEHVRARVLFKQTLVDDAQPKGNAP